MLVLPRARSRASGLRRASIREPELRISEAERVAAALGADGFAFGKGNKTMSDEKRKCTCVPFEEPCSACMVRLEAKHGTREPDCNATVAPDATPGGFALSNDSCKNSQGDELERRLGEVRDALTAPWHGAGDPPNLELNTALAETYGEWCDAALAEIQRLRRAWLAMTNAAMGLQDELEIALHELKRIRNIVELDDLSSRDKVIQVYRILHYSEAFKNMEEDKQ